MKYERLAADSDPSRIVWYAGGTVHRPGTYHLFRFVLPRAGIGWPFTKSPRIPLCGGPAFGRVSHQEWGFDTPDNYWYRYNELTRLCGLCLAEFARMLIKAGKT